MTPEPHPASPPSRTATALARPLAIVLGALAAARRARAFHPVGRAVHATVHVDEGPHPLDALTGTHRAIVRTSRGAGLPASLPDVHGVALRLLGAPGSDGSGDDSVLDLPLASAGDGRVSRHLLRPGRDPFRPTYSSLAPYADGAGDRFVVGARFRTFADLELLVARPPGPWRPVGSVHLGAALADDAAEALGFDPFTCPPSIEPVGLVNELRRPAYRASQARRPRAARTATDGTSARVWDREPDGSGTPC